MAESADHIETCFARLDRTDEEVWKRRKPIHLQLGREDVDLRSIEGRRAACLEEARLARILAPDVALDVVPLAPGPDGAPQPQASGQTVDWAFHMRRLRDDDRADRRLEAGTLDDDHLVAVARRIALLHERTRGSMDADPTRARDVLRDRIRLRIGSPEWAEAPELPPECDHIERWQLAFLETHAERFDRRARTAAIREGHGELALDHVYLDDEGGLQILPGLEMGPALRSSDVAGDVALLATDLAARRRVDLAERFVAEYARLANDFDLYPLLDFYSSLKASLRGKLDWICAQRLCHDAQSAARYRARARRFLALALAAPRRPLLPPVVVAMGGQVASGKSTVARHIAQRIGAPVVGSDPTRDYLLGARLNPALHEARWQESYEPGFADRVYDEVLRRAGEVLDSGRPVVIDGCFRSRSQRRRARQLAERFEHPFLFVEAQVDRAVQLERLAERSRRDDVPIDDWRQIADAMRADWEPADDLPDDEHLALDTAQPLEHNAHAIEQRLPTWPHSLTG